MIAREFLNFHKGPFVGGFTFFPYQLALGISIRFWFSLFGFTAIRLYLGPFKFWCFLDKEFFQKEKRK